jgi:thiol:disulfide interchange protein DsbG
MSSERPAMRITRITVALLLSVLIGSGYCREVRAATLRAGAAPTVTLARADRLVRSASSDQYHALRVFQGSHGLTGVVVQAADSSTSVVWISPDHAAVIVGTLFDARANDLNQAALVNLGFRYRPAESLRRASLAAAQPLVAGSAGPILTAFIDANCIYCHMLYQQLMPYVSGHKVRVRFVMVGLIKPDSGARAIAILSSPDPLAALQRDQDAFDTQAEEGGFPIEGAGQSPAAVTAVRANNALISRSGIDGTPAFLYCSKSRGAVRQLIGMPPDLSRFLADLSTGPARECGASSE